MSADNPLRMMSKKHSLSTKLLISAVLWVFFAVIFTGYTLTLLWQLESGGIIINESGSLRMRVYHMATLTNDHSSKKAITQEQQNFEQIISHLKSIDRSSFLLADDTHIQSQLTLIEQTWHSEIRPLINSSYRLQQPLTAKDYATLDEFVATIDKLVKQIEIQNTKHIALLRLIQSLLIVMVLITAFTSIYFLFKLVIRPLSILQSAIEDLSDGKLDSCIEVTTKDEFGMVSHGFNQMANNLEDLYLNLEQKVQEKTASLEEKNHELSDLYGVTAFLQESHSQEFMSEGFLLRMIGLSNADAGSIRLLDAQSNRLNYVVSHGLPDDFISGTNCHSLDCYCGQSITNSDHNALIDHRLIIKSRDTNVPSNPCENSAFARFIIFHICHNYQEMGIMTLYFADDKKILSAQSEHLIETLTRQYAVALENQQLVLKDKQFAVMEERNRIAQGLHDSIAQSLSFLNIQVQMLQDAIKNNESERIDKSLSFIQQGIQESYDDVRELLINFRTKMNQRDFDVVVQSAIERFKQQTKVSVNLTMSGNGPSLNPQQQLQVIFILQEALSNIRKHAKCSQVNINITNNEQFMMSIEDNGCGFTRETIERKKSNHVGMSIMQERASQILGDITIHSEPDIGTCITLVIAKEQRGVL